MIKRFYRPEWGDDWRRHLSVDEVNGAPAHELKLDDRKHRRRPICVSVSTSDGNWRVFKLRQDFIAAEKVQMEDDITASMVVPVRMCIEGCGPQMSSNPCIKLVKNCEYRLFQRPDDAIHRWLRQADRTRHGATRTIFSPISSHWTSAALADLVEDVHTFHKFTAPMQRLIAQQPAKDGSEFCRIFRSPAPGRRQAQSKNPRYLQVRPDLVIPERKYLAEMGTRLQRKLDAASSRSVIPVNAVLAGRRNNPAGPRHPAAGRLQPDPLPGTAGAVHGFHLQSHRQVALDDRCRLAKAP